MTAASGSPHADHYDVVVIGSGPGGGTTAAKLAGAGKRVLLLERGDYLPRERDNWDSKAVFGDRKYNADETFYDINDNAFQPELHYCVSGNSKVYGAALFRLRPSDFSEVRHSGGVSPAWPIRYDEMEPYYVQAEHMYWVHGRHGEDRSLVPPAGTIHSRPSRTPRASRSCRTGWKDSACTRSTCRWGST